MATISKTGISNGSTIESEHITRIIDALDGTSSAEIVATGSFTGSFTGNMAGTASFATTASFALNAVTPSYYTLTFSNTLDNVNDASTYYIGNDQTAYTGEGFATFPVAMLDGTITHAFYGVSVRNPGTGEVSKIAVYNVTTGVSASNVDIYFDSRANFASSSISPGIPVNAGDKIGLRLVAGTFATNPSNVRYSGYVLIQL